MKIKNSNNVSKTLRDHYSKKFTEFGPTAKGVDWGTEKNMILTYGKMLNVIEQGVETPTILDVGCGYGGLYLYAQEREIPLTYSGIDISENMIEYAKINLPGGQFFCGDIFDFESDVHFDYVVCNGILTQKLSTSIRDMDIFANQLIRKMFSIALRGIAFNIMTTKVNFMVDNLYYRNPIEMLAFCLTEITSKVRMDHAYPMYEYTTYLYKE